MSEMNDSPTTGTKKNENGVHDGRAHNGLQLVRADGAMLNQQRPHITIRLIATVQQMTQFTARPQQIGQAGNQIRNLGRASERDMAPVKVDGPGRVPVNLQDTGSALQGETLQDSSDLRTRWRI